MMRGPPMVQSPDLQMTCYPECKSLLSCRRFHSGGAQLRAREFAAPQVEGQEQELCSVSHAHGAHAPGIGTNASDSIYVILGPFAFAKGVVISAQSNWGLHDSTKSDTSDRN